MNCTIGNLISKLILLKKFFKIYIAPTQLQKILVHLNVKHLKIFQISNKLFILLPNY